MKVGNISQSIYDRSVKKVLTTKQAKELKGAGLDCAFFADSFATGQIALQADDLAVYALYEAYNKLVAMGSNPKSATVMLTLTTRQSEAFLKRVVKALSEELEKLKLVCTACQVEVVDAVMAPIAHVMLAGADRKNLREAEPELDIVMCKPLACAGTAILAQLKQEDLLGRFPFYFMQKAQSHRQRLSVRGEASLAQEEGFMCHPIGKGGLFGALWQLGEQAGIGMELMLKSIPISQETIEICELYDLNPYELYGVGGLLVVTRDGESLVNRLADMEVWANVIGRTKAGNDRVILAGEERRFLEPTKPDELLKVI